MFFFVRHRANWASGPGDWCYDVCESGGTKDKREKACLFIRNIYYNYPERRPGYRGFQWDVVTKKDVPKKDLERLRSMYEHQKQYAESRLNFITPRKK